MRKTQSVVGGLAVTHRRLGDGIVTGLYDVGRVYFLPNAEPDPVVSLSFRYLAPWGYLVRKVDVGPRYSIGN